MIRVSPSGGGGGDPCHYLKNWLVPPPCPPPTVLTQKCQFCNFDAVFGHFVQIAFPTSRPHLGNPDDSGKESKYISYLDANNMVMQ